MIQKGLIKAISLVVAVSIMISVSACSNGNSRANESEISQDVTNEEVEKALEMSETEPYIEETVDSSFLVSIEESIVKRMEMSDNGSDYATLVNTELAYLEKYYALEFEDLELQELAKKYIDGLYIQRDSLDEEYEYENQIEWQRGIVYRYEALQGLYENYNFLKDNAEFVGTYISQLEYEVNLLVAYEEIEADISEQIQDDFPWELKDDCYLYGTVSNNTGHTFSTVFEFMFYDTDGVLYESNTAYIENIAPGSTYAISAYVDAYNLDTFTWSNYYYDVKYGETDESQSNVNIAYETYLTAINLTKSDLSGSKGNWSYNGLPLLSDDCDWIDNSNNTNGTVENGAIYRKIAMCLEAFSLGNNWSSYAEILLGFMPDSREEFAPYVENAQAFIVTDDSLIAVMKKLETMESVTGEFDFDYLSFGKYTVDIVDMTICAEEMQISEEMFGYILAMLTEYGAEIVFDGNSCNISYTSYY